jgi:AcrR family transcriptional regulator
MRTVGSSRDKTWPIIRKTGIKLLFKHGFEGMNLRLLASESGLQAGSLYNYFDNKNEFLATIVCDIMKELLQQISDALDGVLDPEERLRNFVSVMVTWHTKRKKEAIVSQSEIRNLPKGRYEELIGLRKEFELILRKIIDEGVAAGVFRVLDARLLVVAILNMLTGIAGWYKPNGRLDVETLVGEYTDIVTKMLLSGMEIKAARGIQRRVQQAGRA